MVKPRRKSDKERFERFGARMSDYRPKVTTPVVRQQLEDGSWRVIMLSFPPVLLAEGVSEVDAIEIRAAKLEELGRLIG